MEVDSRVAAGWVASAKAAAVAARRAAAGEASQEQGSAEAVRGDL